VQLDVMLTECEHASQPELAQNIKQSGVTVVEASLDLAGKVSASRLSGVSTLDMMTWCQGNSP